MKRGLVICCFAVLLAAAFRKEGIGQANLVTELAPGVFHRKTEPEKRIIANTSWIVFRDYVVVIDGNFPWGARAVLADLKRTTDKPVKFVFDTHYHGDHAFGNSVWVDAGATIICSEDCAAESKTKNTASWNNNTATGEYSLKPYRLEHPQVTFRDRMVIEDPTHRLELLRVGPAHTRGDAVAYLPKERILFGGDVIVNGGGHNIADPDADLENWVRAFDSLATKDIATVVPGHGAVGTLETIRGDRAYMAGLVTQVRNGIAAGKTAEQIAASIDLTLYGAWGSDPARNQAAAKTAYAQLTKKR